MPKSQIAALTGAARESAPAPDDAALLAAATAHVLPSGRCIWWLAPDEMEMLAFTGELPDPLTSRVYLLLRDEGSLPDEKDDPATYQREFNAIEAEFVVIKHGMVKPKFDPSLAIGDGVNVIGRRQLSRGDRRFIMNWLFRVGTTPEAFSLAQSDQPAGAAQPPRDSGGIPPDAGTADGDN
jgi:hypothetical protein